MIQTNSTSYTPEIFFGGGMNTGGSRRKNPLTGGGVSKSQPHEATPIPDDIQGVFTPGDWRKKRWWSLAFVPNLLVCDA